MILDFIIAILIARYIKRRLHTAEKLPQWDKILDIIFYASIALLAVSVLVENSQPAMIWVAHAILLYIVYILYTRKEFKELRSYLLAIAPYILVSLAKDIIELNFLGVHKSWKNISDIVYSFSIVWLIAMLVINKRQQGALQKERLKTREEEEQNRIMTRLKAELEVQVAERTAEITLQKEELQHALDDLRATQTQLIQSEKMASLGELTAGIAHEIQNPLNFVNNFSEVNTELIEEMKAELQAGNQESAVEIANDIAANEQKINYHGKRADAIVKGMLQHSRSSDGVKEPTNINDLADEYLRLAYHGLRAKNKSFNATMNTDFDNTIGNINIIPQDIGRVILNLLTNAFYAVAEKKKQSTNDYEPTVSVRTKKVNDKVEIHVNDNGLGIPQPVMEKIFQPFFTTKPTGEGTGLGLSMSYDIITKGHGGQIKVNTEQGNGSEFTIILPLNNG